MSSDLDAFSENRVPVGLRLELMDGSAVAIVVDYFDDHGPAFQLEGQVTPQDIAGLYHWLARRQGWSARDCASQASDGREGWREVPHE